MTLKRPPSSERGCRWLPGELSAPIVARPAGHFSEFAVPPGSDLEVVSNLVSYTTPHLEFQTFAIPREQWMARKFILCFFQDRLHAIVSAEQEDSRLEGARERGLLISLHNQHRTYFCPDKENSVFLRRCCAAQSLAGGRFSWERVAFFSPFPPPPPPPLYFALDFLAPEEGAAPMGPGGGQRWLWLLCPFILLTPMK